MVSYLHDVLGQLSIYSMGGQKRQDVALPGLGNVTGPLAKPVKTIFTMYLTAIFNPKPPISLTLKLADQPLLPNPKSRLILITIFLSKFFIPAKTAHECL